MTGNTFYWAYWICIKDGSPHFEFSGGGFMDLEQAKEYAKQQAFTGCPICAWVVCMVQQRDCRYKYKDIPYMEVFNNAFKQQVTGENWLPFRFDLNS